jgi:TPR repeat protein
MADDLEAFKILSGEGVGHRAEYLVGVCYEQGLCVDADHVEAAKYYQRAAEGGDSDAQTKMGWLCQYGLMGTEKDYNKAEYWYRLAAVQQNIHAQNGLKSLASSR